MPSSMPSARSAQVATSAASDFPQAVISALSEIPQAVTSALPEISQTAMSVHSDFAENLWRRRIRGAAYLLPPNGGSTRVAGDRGFPHFAPRPTLLWRGGSAVGGGGEVLPPPQIPPHPAPIYLLPPRPKFLSLIPNCRPPRFARRAAMSVSSPQFSPSSPVPPREHFSLAPSWEGDKGGGFF